MLKKEAGTIAELNSVTPLRDAGIPISVLLGVLKFTPSPTFGTFSFLSSLLFFPCVLKISVYTFLKQN